MEREAKKKGKGGKVMKGKNEKKRNSLNCCMNVLRNKEGSWKS